MFDGVVYKTFGDGVIDKDGGGRLGMSEFGKGGTNGDSLLDIEECAPILAYTADNITLLMILETVYMGP